LAVVLLRSTYLRGVYGYVASSEEVNVLLHYVWHVSRMFSGYGFFFFVNFFSPLFLPREILWEIRKAEYLVCDILRYFVLLVICMLIIPGTELAIFWYL
jgi:hypothetical protein